MDTEGNAVSITLTVRNALVLVFAAGFLAGAVAISVFVDDEPPTYVQFGENPLEDGGDAAPTGDSEQQPQQEEQTQDRPTAGTEDDELMIDGAPAEEYEFDASEFNTGLGEGSFEWPGGDVSLQGKPYIGSEEADIVIVTYEDFDCGFCGEHNTGNFYKIVEEYAAEGDVQYFYKHFNTMHTLSDTGDIAVQCALRQDTDAFWDMKNWIYQNQGELNSAVIRSEIEQYSDQTGLDTEELMSCIDNQETIDSVEEDQAEAESFDYPGNPDFVRGTPGFLIYNTETGEYREFMGSGSYDRFNNFIQEVY